ncbi:hypothetical protein CRG98_025866 [Punica granatum]|uniref:Uncharacterized protein n=1 Tax=Punica granatum TaxID=22663 RepID=A0A2I0JDK7_PUNGR|nr:hypothetical protein CRG98_025866 [Punica granatum]
MAALANDDSDMSTKHSLYGKLSDSSEINVAVKAQGNMAESLAFNEKGHRSQKENKFEISMEEIMQRAAPYTAILNKMIGTLGEAIQQDVRLQRSTDNFGHYLEQEAFLNRLNNKLWPRANQPHIKEVMDDSAKPDVQMVEEVDLVMPPLKP